MPLAEATAVAADATRPAACCYQRYDPLAARAALVALATWCERFSPVVGLEEGPHPESLLLDVTGLGPLFGDESALITRVARELRAQGWQVRLALADTIGTAWAVAHYAPGASEMAGMIISPGESLLAVACLPVAALRLTNEQAGFLADLGLAQIGQLQALPRSSLAARLGPELLQRWDQLLGTAEEVIHAEALSPALEATWSFEQPVARNDVIEAVSERLLERLVGMLLREQRGVVRLECELLGSSRQQFVGNGLQVENRKGLAPHPALSPRERACEERHFSEKEYSLHEEKYSLREKDPQRESRMRIPVSVGLFRPSASPRYLFELVRMQLDRLRLTEPVAEIRIKIIKTELLECRQGELFEISAGRDDPRALAMLVDRLSSRLGRQCVLRVDLSSDAQPEEACRYESLVGNESARQPDRSLRERRGADRPTDRRSPRGKSQAANRGERHFKWSQRPLRLAPWPVPLAVVAVVPDGPLLWFTLGNERRHVTRSWGPERIETGWWRGRGVRRDYYRVETQDGHRHWLFRRRSDGQWFWHGNFD
jgi:protein ImuB